MLNTSNLLRKPRLYMRNFLRIRNLKKRIVPFVLNHAQRIAHRAVQKQKKVLKFIRVINLKARKLGMSTYWDGRIFHNTVTVPGTSSVIVCHDSESVQSLLSMCKLFYEELPEELRPMRRYYSKKALVFENPDDKARILNPGLRSSLTVATAKSAKFGRAPVFHNVHLSEIAFYEKSCQELLTGVLNAVPDEPGTLVVKESTSNGAQGQFFDDWQKAMKGEDYYIPLFLAWHIFPDYAIPGVKLKVSSLDEEEKKLVKNFSLTGEQLEWRRRTIRNRCQGKLEIFKQEYPSTPKEAFIYAGSNIFSGPVLEYYSETHISEPILISTLQYIARGRDESASIRRFLKPSLRPSDDENQLIKFYKMPEPNMQYFLGADASEGISTGDKPGAIVLDSQGEECACFSGKLDPISYAIMIAKIGLFYNQALLIPEANNHGGTVIAKLIELFYPDLYRRESHDTQTRSVSKRVGWFNNGVTKLIIINFLRSALEECVLKIHSRQILTELEGYVKRPDGSMGGDGVSDDLVISLALATYAAKDNLEPIFERKKIHEILHVREEQAEKIQQVMRGEYVHKYGTLGYFDDLVKLASQDDEDEDMRSFEERFTDQYYGRDSMDWPMSLADYNIG